MRPLVTQSSKKPARLSFGDRAKRFVSAVFGNFGQSTSPYYRQPYEGAAYSRPLRYYYAGQDSDRDISYDLPDLRTRSRDLYRNNAIGRGAIKTMATNVVGSGLQMQASIDSTFLNMNDEQKETWEYDVERKWRAFEKVCDASRKKTFRQLQKLAYLSQKQSGDCFVLLPNITYGGQSNLRIQLIEADKVANPIGVFDYKKVLNGIEFGDYNEPIAYYIYDRDNDYKRVDAYGSVSNRRNVLHLFDQDRPNQTRGIPFLAPVIETLKQLGDYKKSELTASIVASLFAVFIKSNRPEAGENPFPAYSQNNAVAGDTENEAYDYTLGPGSVTQLGEGEEIDVANPGRPNTAFEAFITAVLREVGMALEIPYEILAKQFMASYSASRGAKVEFFKVVKSDRIDLVDNFCQPIYEEWLTEQVLIGSIKAPGFLSNAEIRTAYCGTKWVGESMGQIDEVKEVLAAQMRIESGFSTHQDETSYLTGTDFEQNAKKLKRERELIGYAAGPSNAVMSKEIIDKSIKEALLNETT